jgi:hypothetical protein
MSTLFRYGPYSSISFVGLSPGQEESWWFGPWPWYANAVVVTAHPFALTGADRRLEVTSVSSGASPNGDRFIYCTVRNIGRDPANYAVWLGGVAS